MLNVPESVEYSGEDDSSKVNDDVKQQYYQLFEDIGSIQKIKQTMTESGFSQTLTDNGQNIDDKQIQINELDMDDKTGAQESSRNLDTQYQQ